MRDTSDLEIPVSPPSALTRSSTERVQGFVDAAASFEQHREERS